MLCLAIVGGAVSTAADRPGGPTASAWARAGGAGTLLYLDRGVRHVRVHRERKAARRRARLKCPPAKTASQAGPQNPHNGLWGRHAQHAFA
ncbi:MAG: hypothetical protein WDN04_24385 [Rhodospirillales bacterium]